MTSREGKLVPKGKNIDIGWKYNGMVEPNNTKKIRCDFCGFVSNGGISRAKDHQMAKKGSVVSCERTPDDVIEILRGAQEKKLESKESYNKEDDDDLIEIDQIGDLRAMAKRPHGSISSQASGSSSRVPNPRGPMDNFLYQAPEVSTQSKRRQVAMNEFDKEAKERTDQYVARCIYTNGLPFNLVRSRNFKLMLGAVGQFGKYYTPPSYHDVRVPLLKKEVALTEKMMEHNVEERVKVGCSIMSDGWSDMKNRGIINFLVNTPSGSMFVKSIDGSSFSKTGERLCELLDSFVKDMGIENVVQVVTDNGANYKLAGLMLEAKRPTLFWTPCAAHCVDLMLEDIGEKIPRAKRAIKHGVALCGFIYNHAASLHLMREATNKHDLVRFAITRFATHFLSLQRLHSVKNCLRKLFTSEEWNGTKESKDPKGKEFKKLVLSTSFWNDVVFTLKAMGPLVKVLRLVDNGKNPAMGYVYEAMMSARRLIVSNFDDNEEKYESVLKIVDSRWDYQFRHPLHCTGYYLNPAYYYKQGANLDNDLVVTTGFHTCVEKLCTQEAQDAIYNKELNLYKKAMESFAQGNAIKGRETQHPAQWWDTWGNSAPNLKRFATKILNLTCSSSGCERNWSTFEQIHSKKRNRHEHLKLQELVYVQYNQKLKERFTSDTQHAIQIDEFLDDSEWVLGTLEPKRKEFDENGEEILDEAHWEAVSNACEADGPSTNVYTRREARAKASTSKSKPSSSSARPSKGKAKRVSIIDDDDYEDEFMDDESEEEEEEEYVDEDSGGDDA